ncbi:MAG: CPBP family intramembrane metalloprotease [Bacteroidales bacterium]|nr:CPBP family intramembrane metalloprotease [Bacteroidales bacterium]
MNKKNIIVYTAIVFALIWTVAAVFRLSGGSYQSMGGQFFAAGCMFIPLVTTIILQLINKEKVFSKVGISWKINGWWFAGWLLIGLLLPILVLGASLLVPGARFSTNNELLAPVLAQMNASLPGDFKFGPFTFGAFTLVSGLIAGITINGIMAFGEEVGWRGYLLRQFKGSHFMTASLLTGIIWGLWHAPLILLGHNYPTNPVAGVFMMIALCLVLTPMMQYFRLKSRSVIVSAIMHGTFNAVAGITIMYVIGYNEFLTGTTGLAGILTMLFVDFCLFLYDRYVTKERLFTSVLN